MSEPVYLDHHSATPPFSEALDAYFRMAKEYWGDISCPHFVGQQPIYPMQKKVDALFAGLGMQDSDAFFITSSEEESLNRIFLNTYLQVTRHTGKTLFLTTKAEEEATYSSLKELETLGCMTKLVPLNEQGQVTASILESFITAKTAAFSISWANGLTGVIQPIQDLAEICKQKNIILHVDASYVLGKSFFRFQDLQAQFVTLSGSVIGAMPGMNLILARAGSFLTKESKAEPLPSIAALAQAVLERQEKFEQYCMETARLRDHLEKGITQGVKGSQVLCKNADRLPNCSVLAFPGIYAEALLYLLNSRGVYASIGGGKFQPLEKILVSYGCSIEVARSALSFALSWNTTEEEIDHVINIVIECMEKLRRCSGENAHG